MSSDSFPLPDSVSLLVCGHSAAYRCVDLAVALARSQRLVSIVLSPGSQQFVPTVLWKTQPDLSSIPVIELQSDGSSSPEPLTPHHLSEAAATLLVLPVSWSFLGRLRSLETGDPAIRQVLAHCGPCALVLPEDGSLDQASLCGLMSRELSDQGYRIYRGQTAGPGQIPGSDELLAWLDKAPGVPSGGANRSDLMVGSSAVVEGGSLPSRNTEGAWAERRLLITAGPTKEPIDDFHVLTTRATGELGLVLAQVALDLGANVTLVTGQTGWISQRGDGWEVVAVEQASQMLEAIEALWSKIDGIILADGASIFRIEKSFPQPVLRTGNSISLRVVETPDPLQWASQQLGPEKPVVGFQIGPLPPELPAAQILLRRRIKALVTGEKQLRRLESEADLLACDRGLVLHRIHQEEVRLSSEDLPQLLSQCLGWSC